MKTRQRTQSVPVANTIAVRSRAQTLKVVSLDVVGFGAGVPDFDTLDDTKLAVIEAMGSRPM